MKHSQETKEKIRLKLLGRKLSSEVRKRMSEGQKGKIYSEESKRKMSEYAKNRSEEHRRKLSEAYKVEKHFLKGGVSKKPGYKTVMENNRKARKKENGGSHTLGEWDNLKAQYDWTCPCCKRKEPEIKLTEDHIISLKKGGSSNIENIQPLCQSCNSKKMTKMIRY